MPSSILPVSLFWKEVCLTASKWLPFLAGHGQAGSIKIVRRPYNASKNAPTTFWPCRYMAPRRLPFHLLDLQNLVLARRLLVARRMARLLVLPWRLTLVTGFAEWSRLPSRSTLSS